MMRRVGMDWPVLPEPKPPKGTPKPKKQEGA